MDGNALFGANDFLWKRNAALEAENIESRPLWKPMHLQPVFRSCPARGGAVAARLFETGLCLPSGSSLSDAEQSDVIAAIAAIPRRAGAAYIRERMARA